MFKQKLQKYFKEYDIELNEKQTESFAKYYAMLVEENKKFNLTTIVNEEDVIIKHFIDSVLPYKYFIENSTLVDIGAGAGFPSVPLMIMRDDLYFLIIDSVNKKVEFIKKVCKELNLNNCEIVHGRCEDLAKMPKYRENYDYCIARGVANLSSLLEYCVAFIKVKGQVFAYKAKSYLTELENCKNTCKVLNLSYFKSLDYELNDIITEEKLERHIMIFDKSEKTPVKYPRTQNKVRTQPLN